MTLLLSDEDVQRVADPRGLVDAISMALRSEAAGETAAPPRLNVDKNGTFLRLMPAILPANGVMGVKVFHGTPDGPVRYLISLYSAVDGEPLAIVDACYLTAARTAATTALAARHLLNGGPHRLGLIGSGLEARTHARALVATCEIDDIAVFSPNEQRRTLLVKELEAEYGISSRSCDSAAEVAATTDHVVVATNTGPSATIAFRAEWCRFGQHISAIGSTNAQLRELDTDMFRRPDRMVFDASADQLAEESGDVIAFCAEGGDPSRAGWLTDIVAGAAEGRSGKDELTLFKSVGTALQDVAAADLVYRRAVELSIGHEVASVATAKIFNIAIEGS